MITDDKVRKLIEWISENAWRESRALYPNPTEHVHAGSLLDAIRDTWDLREIDIQAIVDKSTKPVIQTNGSRRPNGLYRFTINDSYGITAMGFDDDPEIAAAKAYGQYFHFLLDDVFDLTDVTTTASKRTRDADTTRSK